VVRPRGYRDAAGRETRVTAAVQMSSPDRAKGVAMMRQLVFISFPKKGR
jgi:hypothetical protein